jgi:glycosyltransferase involved in cell wall biosynthesis
MFSSPFSNTPQVSIPDSAQIIFVSDLFAEDHLGGAELTTDAIIKSSPFNVFKLRSKEVNNQTLSQGQGCYWIFGNFSAMDERLIPTIIGNMRYSIIEYDYKYCMYRSPEKHQAATGSPCNCHNETHGKMMSAFFHGADSLWWMSHVQMEKYKEKFPFLAQNRNNVLSSVFDDDFFEKIAELFKENNESRKEVWSIVGSESWIKGVDDSESYCKEKNIEYKTHWKLPYSELLKELSLSKGLVFLPKGGDTCPRIVIEAKLLGCDLVLNENVQHAKEPWFNTTNIKDTLDYLMKSRDRFWKGISAICEYVPTISGYTTTKDCIAQDYPFEASIQSMLGFCDQVVIVDGGSTDGTWEKLEEISNNNESVIIHRQERDWDDSRFAVFDGLQKSLARALCTGEFCWQQDSDEIVHEADYSKIKQLTQSLTKNIDLIALPVIEFWGGPEKIRIDINPWKWRLSRNRPHITHGIPSELRKFDKDGKLYSLPGSDGCDYVRSDTFERVPFAGFYTKEADDCRNAALVGNVEAMQQYTNWFESIARDLPSVYHYSWFNIDRKIKTYKNYWSKHWQSLYDITQEDTPDNNMFFNKSWSDVSEEEIQDLSQRLSEEMGGWIFHKKIDFSNPTPFIKATASNHPEIIKEWIKK